MYTRYIQYLLIDHQSVVCVCVCVCVAFTATLTPVMILPWNFHASNADPRHITGLNYYQRIITFLVCSIHSIWYPGLVALRPSGRAPLHFRYSSESFNTFLSCVMLIPVTHFFFISFYFIITSLVVFVVGTFQCICCQSPWYDRAKSCLNVDARRVTWYHRR